MDEAKRLEIQAWLVKARQDLSAAEWLVTSPDPLYNAVRFHCQQSAKKTIKSYLTWRDEPFEKHTPWLLWSANAFPMSLLSYLYDRPHVVDP